MAKTEIKGVFRKQAIMRRVVLACMPPLLGGIYFFGWRSAAMAGVALAAAFTAEWLFCRKRKEPVSEAVLVTSLIYAIILPPPTPWHVVVIGAVFAIVFSKEVFGGFGRNFFNPAMAGRCFVYICFPVALTANWAPAPQVSAERWWGALDRWSIFDREAEPGAPDAITSLTPLGEQKQAGIELRQLRERRAELSARLGELRQQEAAGRDIARVERELEANQGEIERARENLGEKTPGFATLFWGDLSGTMGVTSVLLILIGGTYLFVTRTASRTIILSTVITYGVLSQILNMFGVLPVPSGLRAVMGGGFLFGAFYMATDPISAPKKELSKVFYGIIIGLGTTTIRNFSVFNGGLMFSILLANMFAPTIDYYVGEWENRRKGPKNDPSAPGEQPGADTGTHVATTQKPPAEGK